jgi:hypothetical protein
VCWSAIIGVQNSEWRRTYTAQKLLNQIYRVQQNAEI